MHRKEWEKEMHALAEHKEAVETDEMGSVLHQRRQVSKKTHHHPKKKRHS
jgi:hypothetical protein